MQNTGRVRAGLSTGLPQGSFSGPAAGVLSWRLSLLSLWLFHLSLPGCFLLLRLQAVSPAFGFLHCLPFSPLGWPQSGSARPVQKQTRELPECGLGHEPHHIDEQNEKEHFFPPHLELKWHIKTCHGFSLGLGHLVSSPCPPCVAGFPCRLPRPPGRLTV